MVWSRLEDVPEARITSQTILRMYQLVDRAKTDAAFQKIVYGVLRAAMPGEWKNYRREAEAILSWARRTVDYRRDPSNVELVQDVWRTLDIRRADCDDFVILVGSALETVGVPVRFVTVSTKPDGEPSHVYLEAFLDGTWLAMDAIIPWAPVGWAPTAGITAKRVWTRRDVGLAGYEERPLEGIGMHDSMPNGWIDDNYNTDGRSEAPGWEDGFARGMFHAPPPVGTSARVSNTFAPGMPGDAVLTQRVMPSKPVNSLADERKIPRSEDPSKPYPYELAMEKWKTPQEQDTTGLRSQIPRVFTGHEWANAPPTWQTDQSALLPYPRVEKGPDMYRDLAGLGQEQQSTMDEIVALGKSLFSTGQAPSLTAAAALAMKLWQERQAAKEAAKKALEAAQAAAMAPVSVAASVDLSRWVVPGLVVAAVLAVGSGLGLTGRRRRR